MYKQEDPATKKQLAVPVDVPNHVFLTTRNGKNSKEKAMGELTLLAFYFLLHMGEYTYHGTGKCHTQQNGRHHGPNRTTATTCTGDKIGFNDDQYPKEWTALANTISPCNKHG